MKNLVYLFLAFIVLFSCNSMEPSDFRTINKNYGVIDEALLVSGNNFNTDLDYSATISGIEADVRVISESFIEVTIPEGAPNGPLLISDGSTSQTFNDIAINRLFMVNSNGISLSEYSMINGRKIGQIHKFEDRKILDIEFVKANNSLIGIAEALGQPSDRIFFSIDLTSLELQSFPMTHSYRDLAINRLGSIFSTSGSEVHQINEQNGSFIAKVADLSTNVDQFHFIPALNVLRGFYTTTGNDPEFKFESIDAENFTAKFSDAQEFEYLEIATTKEDHLYSYISGEGIVKFDLEGNLLEIVLISNLHTHLDFYDAGQKLLMSGASNMIHEGIGYQFAIYDLLSRNTSYIKTNSGNNSITLIAEW